MRMPSSAQRKSLEHATSLYQKEIASAACFLKGRGLDLEVAGRWRLGVVVSPEPGHEWFAGRLAIPYINKLGVMAIQFRCLQDHDCKSVGCRKYLWPDGQEMFLYNVAAVDTAEPVIHMTEGAMDAMVLAEALVQPVVGVPGVGIWQQHWPTHFHGFDRVLAWPDGDKAGQAWAAKLRKEIPTVEVIQLPPGSDVNDLYLGQGTEALRALAGIDDGPEVS